MRNKETRALLGHPGESWMLQPPQPWAPPKAESLLGEAQAPPEHGIPSAGYPRSPALGALDVSPAEAARTCQRLGHAG